jgi:hypothetical protein
MFSVVGMRHPNEMAGSTSLYAQPVPMIQPVPLEGSVVTVATRDELEARLEAALGGLRPATERRRGSREKNRSGEVADYLCLFSRWYYRPQAKRAGEILFAGEDGKVSPKMLLRAISRVWHKNWEQGTGSRE